MKETTARACGAQRSQDGDPGKEVETNLSCQKMKDRALLSSSVKDLLGIPTVEAGKSRGVREMYWQDQPLANYTLRMNL